MRFVVLALFPALLAVLCARPAAAQQKDKTPVEKNPDAISGGTLLGGKDLDGWIAVLATSRDPSEQENAIRTIMLYGPNLAVRAVPILLKTLKRHSLDYPVDASVRINSAIALGFILGNLKETDPRQVREAVPLVTRMLADNQVIIRYRAAQAIGQFGPEARKALPSLLAMLKEKQIWENRQAAALALGRIARDDKTGTDPKILNELFQLAKHDLAFQVRLAAVQSLARLGAPAGPGTPALKMLRKNYVASLEYVATHDPKKSVQIWAHMALMAAEGIQRERMSAIGKLLSCEEVVARMEAAQAIGALGEKAVGQVPRLITALDDKEQSVAVWSIWALGRMGKGASEALPRLQKIADNKEEPEILRYLARDAIDVITGKKTAVSSPEKSKGNGR
jgi:HEAT repeat protein